MSPVSWVGRRRPSRTHPTTPPSCEVLRVQAVAGRGVYPRCVSEIGAEVLYEPVLLDAHEEGSSIRPVRFGPMRFVK
jgi:hypothetical protein